MTQEREAVARIIDPSSFYYRAKAQDGFHITAALHEDCDAGIEHALSKADQIIALLGSGGEGWRLVPVEPTPEMCAAGHAVDILTLRQTSSIYRAMLAAAPSPSTHGEG